MRSWILAKGFAPEGDVIAWGEEVHVIELQPVLNRLCEIDRASWEDHKGEADAKIQSLLEHLVQALNNPDIGGSA